MPKITRQKREPTHDWQQIRPLLKDSAHITYEIIRPVILWGTTPKERAAETGMSQRTIYYKANLFDQAGMASVMPATPPPLTLPNPLQEVTTPPFLWPLHSQNGRFFVEQAVAIFPQMVRFLRTQIQHLRVDAGRVGLATSEFAKQRQKRIDARCGTPGHPRLV